MLLDESLRKAQNEVPQCLAIGYVDMNTGMLLGIQSVEPHPQEVMDLVAAATADLFQGPNVTSIEKLFKQRRGVADDGSHYFREIVVLSQNLIHVFIRSKKQSDQAAVFVTRGSANVGMVISKSRMCMSSIEDSL
jgi:hypothetical protein